MFSPKTHQNIYLSGLAVIIFGLVTWVRIRLLGLPIERDEGEYAYMAQQLLQGVLPYTESQSMKFPGIYFVYAGILTFFGESPSAIHLSLVFINFATAYFIFLLGKELLNLSSGIFSAVCFSVLTLSPSFQGLWANAEHFVLLPGVAGIYILYMAKDRPGYFFLSGLLLGIALLIKQHAVFFGLFGVLYLGLLVLGKSLPFKSPLKPLVLFVLGGVTPLIMSAALYGASGNISELWFCTVRYASEYVSLISIGEGYKNFKYNFAQIIEANFTILWLSLVGISSVAWVKNKNREYLFLFGIFVCLFFAVAPGLYFRPHYFLLWAPAISLLAGAGMEGLVQGVTSFKLENATRVGIFILALGVPFLIQKNTFFKLPALQVTRLVYGLNPFPESQEVARFIRNHSEEMDRLAILGSEPEIYFFSKRKSATRFIYMFPLMEEQKFAREMQAGLVREIEEVQPEFVVEAHLGQPWVSPKQHIPPMLKEWSQGYLEGNYQIQGVADIFANRETVYKWGEQAKEYHPQSRYHLLVYKKRS